MYSSTAVQDSSEAFLTLGEEQQLMSYIHSAAAATYRYFRLTPKAKAHDTLQSLRDELHLPEPFPARVSWLRESTKFYAIPASTKLNGTTAYKNAWIYGMDAASGAAVEALRLAKGERVLDLCCAPGAKLCMIAHQLETLQTQANDLTAAAVDASHIVGIDASESRLRTCRQLCKKYSIDGTVKLFLQDGTVCMTPFLEEEQFLLGSRHSKRRLKRPKNQCQTTALQSAHAPICDDSALTAKVDSREWDLPPMSMRSASKTTLADEMAYSNELLHQNQASQNLRNNQALCITLPKTLFIEARRSISVDTAMEPSQHAKSLWNDSVQLFDKVLVDAECTHDGSIRHIQKFTTQWGWDSFNRIFLDPQRIESITRLQQLLIFNGFRLLKPGGILVYSTCSLLASQNEDIVKALLEQFKGSASLYPLPCKMSQIRLVQKKPFISTYVDPNIRYEQTTSTTTPNKESVNLHPTQEGHTKEWPAIPSALECDSSIARHSLGYGTNAVCSVRFGPEISNTSGLFLACIYKNH